MIKKCKQCGREFNATHNEQKYCSTSCARSMRKSLIYGIGINDYPYPIKVKDKHLNFYKEWRSMFYRTIKKYSKNHKFAYDGVYVCEEWKSLSKFKEWYDEHYIEGNVLDKDICSNGERCYSPQNCAFVPKEINNLLTKPKYQRSKINLPLGVKRHSKSIIRPYYACAQYKDKEIISKPFPTPEEAHLAYIEIKEKIIKEQAQHYYDIGKIEKRVYDALMNYKIE